jgi:hypothetical protein
MNNRPISRKSNIVVQDLENEVLIYDLAINKAFCLNQTSGLVYALCDGTRTVFDISDEMSKQLKSLVSEDFVYLALDELRKNNLLENNDELTNHFAGMSRREVVKKVGLASMVALPIIASVVAPSALMAQSCRSVFGIAADFCPVCNDSNCNDVAMIDLPLCPTGLGSFNRCEVNPLGGVGCFCNCLCPT